MSKSNDTCHLLSTLFTVCVLLSGFVNFFFITFVCLFFLFNPLPPKKEKKLWCIEISPFVWLPVLLHFLSVRNLPNHSKYFIEIYRASFADIEEMKTKNLENVILLNRSNIAMKFYMKFRDHMQIKKTPFERDILSVSVLRVFLIFEFFFFLIKIVC